MGRKFDGLFGVICTISVQHMVSQSAAQSLETAIEGHLDYVNENKHERFQLFNYCLCLLFGSWHLMTLFGGLSGQSHLYSAHPKAQVCIVCGTSLVTRVNVGSREVSRRLWTGSCAPTCHSGSFPERVLLGDKWDSTPLGTSTLQQRYPSSGAIRSSMNMLSCYI